MFPTGYWGKTGYFGDKYWPPLVTLDQPQTGQLGGARFPAPSLRTDIARARSRRRERLEEALLSVTQETRAVIEAAQARGEVDIGELLARIEQARQDLSREAQRLDGVERLRAEALSRDGAVRLEITPEEILRNDRNLRLLLLMGC